MKQLTLNLKTESNLGKIKKEELFTDILNDQELKIFKALKPFSSRDEMRPSLCGVYFDRPGKNVVVSDSNWLLAIRHKPVHHGVFITYQNAIVKIQEPFPDYTRVIRDEVSSHLIRNVEVQPLIDFMKKVLPLTIKNQPGAYFHAYGENGIGLNCKKMLVILELQKKWKNKFVDFSFASANPSVRSLQIYSDSPFGKVTTLLMPQMLPASEDESWRNGLVENNVVLSQSLLGKGITGMYSFEQKGLYQPPDNPAAQSHRIRILKLKYNNQKS